MPPKALDDEIKKAEPCGNLKSRETTQFLKMDNRAGEMAQQLRAYVAVVEEPGSAFSTDGTLTTTHTSSSRRSNTLFWTQQVSTLTCTGTHTYMHMRVCTHTHN